MFPISTFSSVSIRPCRAVVKRRRIAAPKSDEGGPALPKSDVGRWLNPSLSLSLAHRMGEGGRRPGEGLSLGEGWGEVRVVRRCQKSVSIRVHPWLKNQI